MQNNAIQNETVHKTICKIMQYKILQWTKLYNTQVNTIYIYLYTKRYNPNSVQKMLCCIF